MKTKKVMAMLVCLCVLLGCFSSCGFLSKNKLPGKYYHENGKCLDIQSDGTYTLEDSYGTGTWKYLDDGETVQFKDFYGEIIEAKHEEDENGEFIVFGYWGEFRKEKQGNDGLANEAGVQVSPNDGSGSVGITYELSQNSANSFNEGRAIIDFIDSTGKEYTAMIDTTGKILYKTENGSTGYYFAYDDASRFYSGVGVIIVDEVYQIVNSEGEVVATSTDYGFDRVAAVGDGMALVCKDNSNVNGSNVCFGIIDSEGNWKQKLSAINVKADADARYVGDGMFQIEESGGLYDYTNVIYNSDTGKSTLVTAARYPGDSGEFFIDVWFENGYAVYRSASSSSAQMKGIDKNFKETTYDGYNDAKNGYLIKKFGVDHYTMYNPTTKETIVFSNYDADQIVSIEFDGDYMMVCLMGKDGNRYFTVYDKMGNEMFTPIKGSGSNVSFSDGKIVYKREFECYDIIDVNGNYLAQNLNYHAVFDFKNDVAVVWLDNDLNEGYINSNGERVLTTLYE